MKGIQIRIATDNSAFVDDYPGEVAAALGALARRIKNRPLSFFVTPPRGATFVLTEAIHDSNGNWIGEARFGVDLPRGWPARSRG